MNNSIISNYPICPKCFTFPTISISVAHPGYVELVCECGFNKNYEIVKYYHILPQLYQNKNISLAMIEQRNTKNVTQIVHNIQKGREFVKYLIDLKNEFIQELVNNITKIEQTSVKANTIILDCIENLIQYYKAYPNCKTENNLFNNAHFVFSKFYINKEKGINQLIIDQLKENIFSFTRSME